MAAKKQIDFDTTPKEEKLIRAILKRAIDDKYVDPKKDKAVLHLQMDITACHKNGCPLDLEKFLKAPKPDFGHDLCGIVKYLDRNTGELTDHFHPRCSAKTGE